MNKYELREYQSHAIQLLRDSFKRGNKRVVLQLGTGGGKSVIATELINMSISKGTKVVFLVNRAGLVNQFSRHLDKIGIKHGILQAQNTRMMDAQVIVGTIQTAARRSIPQDTGLIIIDECHSASGSKDYKNIMFKWNNVRVVGISATPFSKGIAKRYEELAGEPLFQDLVCPISIKELINKGYLVDCEIFAPSEPDLSKLKLQKNQYGEWDYSEKDLGKVVDKVELIGDIVKYWHKLAYDKQTVVFATNILHSKHIVEEFKKAGVSAEHVDCYMSDEEKANIDNRFSKGEFKILSNVSMKKEGWDVPATECMILAKPTKSLISWIQMCGRVLRPYGNKEKALIIDHSGTVHNLGFPTDDLPMELCDGTKIETQRENKKIEKKDIKCPKCHYIKKTLTCGHCGYCPAPKNEVKTQEGELSLIQKKASGKKLESFDKARLFAELKYMANSRGWSHGRLSNVFREIVGTWPNNYHNEKPIPPSLETLNVVQWLSIRYAKSIRNRD